MMKRLLPFLLFTPLLFTACTKNSGKEEEPGPQEPPAIFTHGTPIGDAVKKTIGAAGGTLASKDNTLQIEIPAGALTANTEISVQAVTNTLPGSPGNSYRLLPETVKFTKPVKLTFKYTSKHLDSTDAEALFLAYQSQDGIWRFLPNTTLSTTAKTLTVETTHFSDWAPYAMYWLRATPSSVPVKKTSSVWIYTSVSQFKAGVGSSPMAIIRERTIANNANIRNWKLTGAGTLSPEGRFAMYTAPAKVPQPSTVSVSVEIHNFIPAGVIPGRGASGKLILLSKIKVVDEVYFSGTVNGIEVFCIAQHHKYVPGNLINISGTIRDNMGFSINIENVSRPIAKGLHLWFAPDKGGNATAVYGTFTQPANITGSTFWSKCDAEQTIESYQPSTGNIVIHEVENVDGVEYIRGELWGEFYPQVSCGPGAALPFNLFFRTKAM